MTFTMLRGVEPLAMVRRNGCASLQQPVQAAQLFALPEIA
jgi:hypothetical protein